MTTNERRHIEARLLEDAKKGQIISEATEKTLYAFGYTKDGSLEVLALITRDPGEPPSLSVMTQTTHLTSNPGHTKVLQLEHHPHLTTDQLIQLVGHVRMHIERTPLENMLKPLQEIITPEKD